MGVNASRGSISRGDREKKFDVPDYREDEESLMGCSCCHGSHESGPYDSGMNFHDAMHTTILCKHSRPRYPENYKGCKKLCCGCPF